MKFKSIFGHIKNIITHKYWVYYYGRKLGVSRWQLLMHDMSKFSSIEFWESVKYYQGTSSPIPPCKAANGYSKAWQHHKGRNPHHYEYWTDNYDSGTTLIPMPLKYVEEMLADWFAAGRTYQGKNFTFDSQYNWWQTKKTINPSIHPLTMELIDLFFETAYMWKLDNIDNPLEAWNYGINYEKNIYEWKIRFKDTWNNKLND
jgi:hypothetical protein